MVDKIKDIDGKMITSDQILEEGSAKEVGFRKSLFGLNQPIVLHAPTSEPKKAGGARKSCMKRSSFESVEVEVKNQPAKQSRFEMMNRKSIDGIVIRNRKSMEIKDKENRNKDDSDEGSEHNIFGSQNV